MNFYQALAWIGAVLGLMFIVLVLAMWLDTRQSKFAERQRNMTVQTGPGDGAHVTVHVTPIGGVTPCCGRTLKDLPVTDRITPNPDLVTCPGMLWNE